MKPRRGQQVQPELPADILAGLSGQPPRLPCKYFYDVTGAELFERICEQPEYYPTRTEIGILQENMPAIAQWAGPAARIVEFGSGSGEKTRILLDQLDRPHEYVPIDIAGPQLHDNARRLRTAHPGLRVTPVHGDYTRALKLPPNPEARRTIVFFPGSTIGNFEPLEAAAFLRRAAQLAGPGGGLLIGVDLKKPVEVLERAYNDEAGVTAEFNLNILRHVNELCDADFDVANFEHVAFYDRRRGRIEMHLRSLRDQVVTLARSGLQPWTIPLEEGDLIHTEHSYKYAVDEFVRLAEGAGFEHRVTWMDRNEWFSVHAFDVRGSGNGSGNDNGNA